MNSSLIKALIAIDDTDNLDSPGTGELLAEFTDLMAQRSWGTAGFITRHQLYVHPDIPYTSHNSSMCCAAEIQPQHWQCVIDAAGEFLERAAAPGSDPGLCILDLSRAAVKHSLIAFGRQAKNSVLEKAHAYALAKELDIHLSEHGGTGQGVIGALAGVGLRLSGNDGRMRGTLPIAPGTKVLTAAQLKTLAEVDMVQTVDGKDLPDHACVKLGDMVKTVLLGGRSVLLVKPLQGDSEAQWKSCSNQELKSY